jgi:arylsulfatase A-like enzyme
MFLCAVDALFSLVVFEVSEPSIYLLLSLLSSTVLMYLLLSFAIWLGTWLVMVKLGRVNPGTAFAFVVLFPTCATVLITLVEVFLGDVLNEIMELRPFIIIVLGGMASFLALFITLIAGRFLPGLLARQPVRRLYTVLVFLLLEAVIVVWCIHQFGYGRPMFTGLGALVALALGTPMFWRLSRNVLTTRWAAPVLLLTLLAPLPWTISLQHSLQRPPAFQGQSHSLKRVILITVDTLRHDVLTSNNPTGGITTHMDRIARDGANFSNAFSCAPWTLPAMSSIMTGLPPATHNTVDWYSRLPEACYTLAEGMSDAGYRTAAIGNNYFLAPRTNMGQGFHEYTWYPSPVVQAKSFEMGLAHWLWAIPLHFSGDTTKLTDMAMSWLSENRNQDFFFWLHYYDPHLPYSPPDEYLPEDPIQRAQGKQFWNLQRVHSGLTGKTQAERSWIKALYDGEVRYVDDSIGRLLDHLETLGLYEDALIILTSDHGEEFWDHGGFEHGHSLYNELIQVPLFIKPPDNDAGRTISSYVSTRSILPTVLAYCGLDNPVQDASALSLRDLMNTTDNSPATPPVASSALLYRDKQETIIFDATKYTRSIESSAQYLFNLQSDPGEEHNLIFDQPEMMNTGQSLLDDERRRALELRHLLQLGGEDATEMTPQDIEILRSMGYL